MTWIGVFFKYISDSCKEEELLSLLSMPLRQGGASLICSRGLKVAIRGNSGAVRAVRRRFLHGKLLRMVVPVSTS